MPVNIAKRSAAHAPRMVRGVVDGGETMLCVACASPSCVRDGGRRISGEADAGSGGRRASDACPVCGRQAGGPREPRPLGWSQAERWGGAWPGGVVAAMAMDADGVAIKGGSACATRVQ